MKRFDTCAYLTLYPAPMILQSSKAKLRKTIQHYILLKTLLMLAQFCMVFILNKDVQRIPNKRLDEKGQFI